MGTLRIRDLAPNVFFDRTHGIRFLLSVDVPVTANMMNKQEICPCLCLYPYFSTFRTKGKFELWLAPVR